jgi:hypothetical protein
MVESSPLCMQTLHSTNIICHGVKQLFNSVSTTAFDNGLSLYKSSTLFLYKLQLKRAKIAQGGDSGDTITEFYTKEKKIGTSTILATSQVIRMSDKNGSLTICFRNSFHGANSFLRKRTSLSWYRISAPFMEFETPLRCSQEPRSGPYTEAHESGPHVHNLLVSDHF